MSGIAIISAHFYPAHVRPAVDAIQSIANALGPHAWVAVSNSAEASSELRGELSRTRFSAVHLEHDNEGHEFGAYQAGIDFLSRQGEFDWVVVCNDTFPIHQAFTAPLRNVFVTSILARTGYGMPSVIGQVEASRRSFSVLDCRTNRWITTNIFAINQPAVRLLEGRFYTPRLAELITTAGDLEQFFSPDIDVVLREQLVDWLFNVNSLSHWYGAAPLTEENAPRMAAKCRSILQEKYLAARLDSMSAEFVNVKEMPFLQKCFDKGQAAGLRLIRGH